MTFHFSPLTRAARIALSCGLAALSLGLSGCGGGGSGPSTQSSSGTGTAVVSPSTTPTPLAQTTSCSQSYTPNYKSSVTLLHWTQFPLRVYFVRDSNYSATRQTMATEGFDGWVKATSNGATYTVVSNADQANVTVTFFPFTGGAGDTLGQTNIDYYRDSRTIKSASIELGVTGGRANDVLTAEHEFGHTLGISGHSPSNEDLMYFEGNDAKCGCITPADLNTLLTAYCGNFNKNANALTLPDRGPIETITIK